MHTPIFIFPALFAKYPAISSSAKQNFKYILPI